MFATISIQTYNHAETLARTLESLRSLRCPRGIDYEILVVNNNSSDHTPQIIERYATILGPRLRSVFEGQQGLSHARNRALREARGEVLCFLDDDALADQNWLAGHLRVYQRCANIVAVGGKIQLLWPKGQSRPKWLSAHLDGYLTGLDLGSSSQLMRYPAYPYGCNMSVRRPMAEKVGGFCSRLGRKGSSLVSNEEKHFFYKIHLLEGHVIYAPKALVFHMVSLERLQKRFFLKRGYAQGISDIVLQQETAKPDACGYYWLRQLVKGVNLAGHASARAMIDSIYRLDGAFSSLVRCVYGAGYSIGAAKTLAGFLKSAI